MLEPSNKEVVDSYQTSNSRGKLILVSTVHLLRRKKMESSVLVSHFSTICAFDEDDESILHPLFAARLAGGFTISYVGQVIFIRDDQTKKSHLRIHNDLVDSTQIALKHRALKRFAYILRNNTSLKLLRILGNETTNTHSFGFWLSVGIQYNQSIKNLSVHEIRLGGPNIVNCLGIFLANNPALKRLSMTSCPLGPDDISSVSRFLMRRTANTLKELDLGGNRVGSNHLDMLVMALENNTSLKRLSLRNTEICGDAVGSLAKLLKKGESSLEELDLSKNCIDTEDAIILIDSLENNNKLKTLNLSENESITDQGWVEILKRVLQLVCNYSSVAKAMQSNHILCSILAPHDGSKESYNERRGRRLPMKKLLHQSLKKDHATFLFGLLSLNHRQESDSIKARHKIIWGHIQGNIFVADTSTDIGLMPRILALIGYVCPCANRCESCQKSNGNRLLYQKGTPPSSSVLDTIRLGAVYRIIRHRPEVCFVDGVGDELRTCRRQNQKLRLEIDRLTDEIVRLRSQLPGQA